MGRESVGIDPTATTGETINLMQAGRDDEMTSAVDIIHSRGVLAQVVDNLGPDVVLGDTGEESDAHPLVASIQSGVGQAVGAIKGIDKVSAREEAILELAESLTVDVERGSTVMKLIMEADSAELAQTILGELIAVYEQAHARIHRNPDSQEFFVDQLAQLEQQLGDAQDELREAKNEIGIVSVVDRRSTLEGEVREIDTARYTAEQELSRTMATITELESQINGEPARDLGDRRTIPNEGADLLHSQLYALKVRQLDLKSRFQDDHPLVVAINRQIEEAQRVVDDEAATRQELTDRVNPIHETLSLQLKQQQSIRAGLEGMLETLGNQRQLVMRDLQELNKAEVRIDDLTRRVAVAEKQFFRYSDDLEQARIDAEMEQQRISNISVAQPAALIEKPVSPSKSLVALGSLMLAVAATVSWVLASERFNSRIRTPEEAEEVLGVPTLVALPRTNRIGRLVG